jgi:hypothetical protein
MSDLTSQPLDYFTTLADWRHQYYDVSVGIADPENHAYVVHMINPGRDKPYDLGQFEALLQDPRVAELQALVFQIDYDYWNDGDTFKVVLEAICAAKDKFPHLKALFVGDAVGDRAPEFKKSKVRISDISPFLVAFPELEVLQVAGYLGEDGDCNLNCQGLRHEHLKTLIIETADITQHNIEQVCSMDLPELEYFELWFGRKDRYRSALPPLNPIFSGKIYPKLKYLGICSSEELDTLLPEIIAAPIIDRLAVLNLKMGTLVDAQIEILLDNLATDRLKVLDVTGNNLSEEAIAKLARQPYQVISTHQFGSENYRYHENNEGYEARIMNRHDALYE